MIVSQPSVIFVTGIGTDVGKTLIAAIVTEALEADYWKPVQAGLDGITDSDWVLRSISNSQTRVHPETYRLRLAASPHIAAREEGIRINLAHLCSQAHSIAGPLQQSEGRGLVIEGAGGLLVPLNESELVIDFVEQLGGLVILVSRNYLGSINHSLLTAAVARSRSLRLAGWIFNDQYLDYEQEIADWSDIPKIASIPFSAKPDKTFIREQAERIKPQLKLLL
jgi:dethiobiotin synthetase